MKARVKNLNYKVLLFICLICSHASYARAENTTFNVFLNDLPYASDSKVRPCYPVMARFEHPDPAVTRVRMRYPYNHRMFMFFPVDREVHIRLHEDFMRKGQLSLSDFIAEDDLGNQYGQMQLTFIPVDPEHGEACDAFLNS